MDSEFLKSRAARVNWLLDRADAKGDGAAALGTLIIFAATDEQFERFMSGDFSGLAEVEVDFREAGIKTKTDD